MSDLPPPDNDERIFRAAVTNWPSKLSGPYAPAAAAPHIPAPGRGWLELSVLASAIAIIVPISSALALVSAVLARRAASPKWRAAAGAAVWCGLLGLVVRTGLGGGLIP